MTREEATGYLLGLYVVAHDGDDYEHGLNEALDIAIEALQTPPISQRSMYQAGYRQAQEDRLRGKWIDESGTYYANCSKCGYQIDTHEERGYHNFCPNCGADMRGDTK